MQSIPTQLRLDEPLKTRPLAMFALAALLVTANLGAPVAAVAPVESKSTGGEWPDVNREVQWMAILIFFLAKTQTQDN